MFSKNRQYKVSCALLLLIFIPILHAEAAADAVSRTQVGDQPALPDDGCVYAGLGYSDRVFVNIPSGIYQCRAQHWYLTPEAVAGSGISPADFSSVRTQAIIAGDGCIYAGLGFSDGAVLQTAAGNFLCKSHHWDRH